MVFRSSNVSDAVIVVVTENLLLVHDYTGSEKGPCAENPCHATRIS